MEGGAITEDIEEVVAVAAVDQAAMEEIAAATTPATTTTPTPAADQASQGVRSASRWDTWPLSAGIDSMSPMCRTVEVHLLP